MLTSTAVHVPDIPYTRPQKKKSGSSSNCKMATHLEEEKRKWKEQRKALLPLYIVQALLALLLCVGVLYGGYYLCDCIPIPKSAEDKFSYFIRCCVFPCALVLAWSITAVANKRGESTAANPLAGKEDFVQPQKNILVNTVEQSLLFLMVGLVLTVYLERSELQALPLFSILWVMGRILFAMGYRIHPKYRSFGMMTNFFSTFFFIGVINYLIYTRGFMYGVESERRGSATPASSAKAEL